MVLPLDIDEASFLKRFLKRESAGGILLIFAAILAIVLANTPLADYYALLIETPVEIRVGGLEIAKPLLLWVNDGLMALFFLLVGLELKREFLEGSLSRPRDIVLPLAGALGGMAFPALIYIALNQGDATALKGWATPTATDIAFALGILSLLGSRVPISLKVFLTSLAIFDDIGAILIIAVFYSKEIAMSSLAISLACVVILFLLNRRGVADESPYLLVGAVMWVALLKSGVHATLAGVLLAMFIPNKDRRAGGPSPLKTLEHDLHAAVAFVILPVFAFCNAGVDFRGLGIGDLLHGVSLGLAAGLFFGNQIGVFLLCWLSIRLGIGSMPKGVTWGSLYGTACLCGIGFTMSLFIGSLAFEESGVDRMVDERLGIIVGSVASGLLGVAILRRTLPKATH